MSRKTQRQIIRLALIRAINERQSFVDSWSVGAPEAQTARKEVADYTALLNSKYGGAPSDPLAGAKSVNIQDIPLTKCDAMMEARK